MQLGRLDPGCACPLLFLRRLLWLGRSALSVCQREGRGGILFGGLALSCSSDLSAALATRPLFLSWPQQENPWLAPFGGSFQGGQLLWMDGRESCPCSPRPAARGLSKGPFLEAAPEWKTGKGLFLGEELSLSFSSLSGLRLSARRSWPFSCSPPCMKKQKRFLLCRKESSYFAQPFLLGVPYERKAPLFVVAKPRPSNETCCSCCCCYSWDYF